MKTLTHETFSKLSPELQLDYRYALAFDDMRRAHKRGKPIVTPTIAGISKSPKHARGARVEQWEYIERLSWAGVQEIIGEQLVFSV